MARRRGAEDERKAERRKALLLRAAAFALADHRIVCAAVDGDRGRVVVQRVRVRSVDGAGGFPRPGDDDVRLVRHRDRRIGASPLQQESRPVVPLGNGLVHFFGGDVFRRILRGAVLCTESVGARSGGPGREAAVAGLRSRVANQRALLQGCVQPHECDRHSAAQHHHSGFIRRHADGCALCA